MESVPAIVAIIVASGLLVGGLGVPMWLGKVPPNALYGFRTPLTVTNEEVWYEANRIGGRDLALGGLGMAVVALICGLMGPMMPGESGILALALLPMVPLVLAMLHSFWAISEWVATRRGHTEPEPEARERVDAARRSRAAEKLKE